MRRSIIHGYMTSPPRLTKISPIIEDDLGRLRPRPQTGLSTEVVRELSRIKEEPQWMTDLRLRSLEVFNRKPWPTWGVDLSDIEDLDDLVLYSPPVTGRYNSWDEVPQEMKDTYERLGVPQAERAYFAGVVGVARYTRCCRCTETESSHRTS